MNLKFSGSHRLKHRSEPLLIPLLLAALMIFGAHTVTVPATAQAPQRANNSGNILERSRAAYAALRSYSDTATITTEDILPGAPAIIEHHTVTTLYRAPRQFFFEFTKDPEAGGERFVIWCEGTDFNTWWSTTGVHEKYEKGKGEFAFATASEPTKGSAMLIAPLLFSQANLQGPLLNLSDVKVVGAEDIGAHHCQKLTAEMKLSYSTGNTAEDRSTTVWIDAESMLIRKVFQDTPKGSMVGSASRVTTVFDPQANPQLEDSRFRFTVPSEKP